MKNLIPYKLKWRARNTGYRLIILRKLFFFNILSKKNTDYYTKQCCHLVFSSELFDKIVMKTYFMNIINL